MKTSVNFVIFYAAYLYGIVLEHYFIHHVISYVNCIIYITHNQMHKCPDVSCAYEIPPRVTDIYLIDVIN